jgi:C1A family cysteine protease
MLRRPAAAFQGGLPASVDWVAKGAVTPVKNQEQCGSCWAFSATGALEGAHFVKSGGSLVSLSEQMLVDCDTTDSGCGGGSMDSAFDWAAQAGGLCAESAYAYTGQAGSCAAAKCARVPGSAPASHVDVEPTDAALMAAVAAQPVAVAIEADQSGFQFYSSGVFSGACGTQLDHGVLLVGYGTSAAGVAYYKVKNSWGAAWGQQGYVLLQRGGGHEGGMCGILTSASYPVL